MLQSNKELLLFVSQNERKGKSFLFFFVRRNHSFR